MRDTVVNVNYGGSGVGDVEARLVPLGTPSRLTADLRLVLPADGTTRLEIFDVTGRRVRTLADRWMAAGVHDFHWNGDRENGARAHAGIYFVRAIQGGRRAVTRFVTLP